MPYCVNCGVELAASEKKCPLCFTKAATNPQKETEIKAYPSQSDIIKSNHKRSGITALLLLLIPSFVCLLSDVLADGKFGWSLYLIGAAVCIFAYAFLPLLFKKSNIVKSVFCDVLLTCAYLVLVGYLSGDMSWLLPLGFPVTVLTGLLVLVLLAVFRKEKLSVLNKVVISAISLGLFALFTDIMVNLFINERFVITWSAFVIAPLMLVAALLRYIQSKPSLKEKIVRRFFV